METIVVYVTHRNQEEADMVVNRLLEKGLISCANFLDARSVYKEDGVITKGEEVVSILKTVPEHFESARDEILKIHPYDTPCILKFNAEVNESYGKWMLKETQTINE